MSESASVARARLLLQQGRTDLAETQLREALAEDPQNGTALALLALCQSRQPSRRREAVQTARQAVGLAPDDSFCHYVLAIALTERGGAANEEERLVARSAEQREAVAAVGEAIRQDPYDARYFALLSSLRLGLKEWMAALDAAEKGLEVDPLHVGCTNCRAQALVGLGRKREAGQTLGTALAQDPENPLTHTNAGWALLHAGKPKEALRHFKEALRLNPAMEAAQAGVVEALKAHIFVYRWLLAYFLWMSRLNSRAQWGLVIGGYFLVRILSAVARQQPRLAIVVLPVIVLYMLFALLSWTGSHLFNLLLRLHPTGKYALTRDQLYGANAIGACIGAGILLLAAGLMSGSDPLLLGAGGCLLLMIPVGGTFSRRGQARRLLGLYTVALIVLGAASLLLASAGVPGARAFGTVFFLGTILFGWVANILVIRFA